MTEVDFADITAYQRYKLMASLIVPRPIALVTTLGANGVVNAAPFSMFNMVGEDPPILMLSINRLSDGRLKDTAANILHSGEFVVHMSDEPVAAQMHACGEAFFIQQPFQGLHQRLRAQWVEPERGFATNFRHCAGMGGDKRAAAGHGFQRRQAKAFIARWENQAERVFIKGAQFGITHAPQYTPGIGGRPTAGAKNGGVGGARHGQRQATSSKQRRSAGQRGQVFVCRRIAHHQGIAACFQPVSGQYADIGGDAQHVIATFRQDADSIRRHAKGRSNAPARKLGNR
jgi:hypothetical protein